MKSQPKGKYFEAVGRRKTAIARVRYYPGAEKLVGKNGIKINGRDYENYFPSLRYRNSILAPLRTLKVDEGYIEVRVQGGGIMAQSEAILMGIARAMVKFSEGYKKVLRASGHLTRDSRMVERKKYGLRKARRAHQWKKR
ncbi:MAG: 30S ribosomal protein S9 [Candidatus Colwellbacteria bacterium RIFCSPLOWO2_01_FULL_48_10]|uniref:Small ribosomal subunit protein uS9 n=1 Tax=Candidatus Colwellbacteria bacterium RIFCSPLOWO2_01_FULL_48_10 TaxID=1797690 RepID=A0A1G1Z5D8_9BACT|nr:MAG: 30S ribosomal protein S9 [Candidatus Colwellbacteria bacterium RIFCSPLOWO2_01_FULL_48_10]